MNQQNKMIVWGPWQRLNHVGVAEIEDVLATAVQPHIRITIRDFDWWRREGNLLVENWIPIDMIDIFQQLRVDLLEKLRQLTLK